MKSLILSVSSLLLLAVQVNAKQQPSASVNIGSKVSTSVTSSTYAYTVNDVKNSVNVTYSDSPNSQDVQDDTPMKAKSFTKSFGIDKSDKINLSNQFGSITIKTWDKNEIKVDVEMKAYAKTADEAQKLIDDVSISATKTGDLVSYKTEMGEHNGNWGSSVKNGKTIWRREVKVYYVVYMPANNALTAAQQYGNILMGDFSGPTSIKVQYGNFTSGDLNNANNYINIQYGASNIKDANTLKVKHQYGSGVKIGTVGTLDIDVQYAAADITTVKGSAVVKHQYGRGITIGSVGNLSVNAQYATVKVGTLKGNLICKQQYGNLIVDQTEASKNIAIDSQYTTIDLGFAANYNADFDVEVSYASFKYGSNVTAKREGSDDERRYGQEKKYSGKIGKGGGAKVSVKAQYNGVTFK